MGMQTPRMHAARGLCRGGQQVLRGGVSTRAKALLGNLGAHLPASAFGAKRCGCQDLHLRKPQTTSKGPVPLASFDRGRDLLRLMIKRNV